MKFINYVLILDSEGTEMYSKDNIVDRKPTSNEGLIVAKSAFIFEGNGWQNMDSYQEKKFQDMLDQSAEVVVAALSQKIRKRITEELQRNEESFALSCLRSNLVDAGYKKLLPHQVEVVNLYRSFFAPEPEKELV